MLWARRCHAAGVFTEQAVQRLQEAPAGRRAVLLEHPRGPRIPPLACAFFVVRGQGRWSAVPTLRSHRRATKAFLPQVLQSPVQRQRSLWPVLRPPHPTPLLCPQHLRPGVTDSFQPPDPVPQGAGVTEALGHLGRKWSSPGVGGEALPSPQLHPHRAGWRDPSQASCGQARYLPRKAADPHAPGSMFHLASWLIHYLP